MVAGLFLASVIAVILLVHFFAGERARLVSSAFFFVFGIVGFVATNAAMLMYGDKTVIEVVLMDMGAVFIAIIFCAALFAVDKYRKHGGSND